MADIYSNKGSGFCSLIQRKLPYSLLGNFHIKMDLGTSTSLMEPGILSGGQLHTLLDTNDSRGSDSIGIEATDVSSLLEQFEEASNSQSGFDDCQIHVEKKKVKETSSGRSTPNKEILDKIRASNKRKSTIMLPLGMPSKRGRGQAIAMRPSSATPKLQRVIQKSSASVSQEVLVAMEQYTPKKQPSCTSSDLLSEEKLQVSENYYKDIIDHDYCQNVPKTNMPREDQDTSAGSEFHPDDILELEDGEIYDDLDKDLQQTNEKSDKELFQPQKAKKANSRNYRKREESPVEDDGKYFDKIPSYFTALSMSGAKQVKPKKDIDELKTRINIQDYFEPNPTQNEDSSVYSRLPAYHSCFTNSTKYDSNDMDGPAELSQESKSSSGYSSRSHSPVLRRSCSRSLSRSRSRSHDRLGRSRSRKRAYYSISRSRSRSSTSSYSRSSRSRSRSFSRSHSYSHSRSRSRSRSRSSSPYSRSRSKYRSRSPSRERWLEERRKQREEEKEQKMRDRRIIYVGKIPSNYTKRKLRKRFERFGDIEEVTVHFREHGDNYGFVTFAYTCDAYAAIEKGNDIPGEEAFDLCFGGRRQFCEVEYADLDGDNEIIEEYYPLVKKSDPIDFDALLQQAQKLANNKKKN